MFHRYLIRGGLLVNVIGISRSDRWREEGWSTPATNAEFLADYADFHPDVTGLITVAPPESLIKWGLFVRPPIADWHRGRVVLLGDAAHPILPFLGLGAALAIEDGIVLARALDEAATLPAALAAYHTARIERASRPSGPRRSGRVRSSRPLIPIATDSAVRRRRTWSCSTMIRPRWQSMPDVTTYRPNSWQ